MTTTEHPAVSDTDLTEIRQAIADYCEGYYRRDPEQTSRAYHPECLKRGFVTTELGVTYVRMQTRASMVDVAHLFDRAIEPDYEIVIDDVTGDIATARLYSNVWIDYLHVVRARGRWALLHAAYEERRDEPEAASNDTIAAITGAATDYVAGWYLADPERHLRAYHEECVKRRFTPDGGMDWYSGTHMAELCARREPDPEADWSITIDDVTGDVASVRIDSTDFVDHLHIAKARGRWGLFHASFHIK